MRRYRDTMTEKRQPIFFQDKNWGCPNLQFYYCKQIKWWKFFFIKSYLEGNFYTVDNNYIIFFQKFLHACYVLWSNPLSSNSFLHSPVMKVTGIFPPASILTHPVPLLYKPSEATQCCSYLLVEGHLLEPEQFLKSLKKTHSPTLCHSSHQWPVASEVEGRVSLPIHYGILAGLIPCI